MATKSQWQASLYHDRSHVGTQVGHETIMSGHQLVELAAGRGVLILEAKRFARRRRPERSMNDLFIHRRQYIARARKEAGQHRVALDDCWSMRRLKT